MKLRVVGGTAPLHTRINVRGNSCRTAPGHNSNYDIQTIPRLAWSDGQGVPRNRDGLDTGRGWLEPGCWPGARADGVDRELVGCRRPESGRRGFPDPQLCFLRHPRPPGAPVCRNPDSQSGRKDSHNTRFKYYSINRYKKSNK